jgi:hypothetical protein
MVVSVLTERELETLRNVARTLDQRGLKEESAALWSVLTASRRDEVRASVAASILRVTPQTIRNWVKRGTLDGRTDATGHVYVQAASFVQAIEMEAILPRRTATEPDLSDDDINAEIAAYRAEQRAG